MHAFQDVTPCRLVYSYRYFELYCFLYLQCPYLLVIFTLKYQLIAHYFNTLCKTHAKICRSNPLKFISLLHVSILKDHHQGVNVPLYEVIECFWFC